MSKPLIAIVGRPNVGKSTLFNKLAGARISIVQDTPGVTRDRIYYECEWQRQNGDAGDTAALSPIRTTRSFRRCAGRRSSRSIRPT